MVEELRDKPSLVDGNNPAQCLSFLTGFGGLLARHLAINVISSVCVLPKEMNHEKSYM